jgi:hypothetical protein
MLSLNGSVVRDGCLRADAALGFDGIETLLRGRCCCHCSTLAVCSELLLVPFEQEQREPEQSSQEHSGDDLDFKIGHR